MTTPRRGLLFHFTHVDNLSTIASNGLLSDLAATSQRLLTTDVGNQRIKSQRRERPVPINPWGVVADYVPFYFAARSPMLGSVHIGNVPTYDGGQDGLIYLVTDIDTIVDQALPFVFTDLNAVIDYARFGDRIDDLDDFVDWPLMESQWWNNTTTDPDRMARRMAEFLVHRKVPWEAFIELAARSDEDAASARASLASVSADAVVHVRQDWYF